MKRYITVIASICLVIAITIIGGFGLNKLPSSYAMTAGGEVPALKSFTLKSKNTTSSGIVSFDLDYEYTSKLSFVSIILENVDTLQRFYFSTTDLMTIDLNNTMEYLYPGQYKIVMVSLFSNEIGSDAYYQSREYELTDEDRKNNVYSFDFSNQILTVVDEQENNQVIENEEVKYAVSLNTESAMTGDKVNVVLSANNGMAEGISNAMLSFTNQNDGSVLNVYVKSINSNPYFIVPSSASVGTYYLDYAYVTTISGEKILCSSKDGFVANNQTSFNVIEKEFDKTKYVLNNEEIEKETLNELAKLNNDAIITINANKNSIISKEIFESIKNTKKTLFIDYGSSQWVFSGKDITNPKTIDVSILVENLQDSKNYDTFLKGNVAKSSAILNFSDNGELPGKVLIRLNSEALDNIIKSDKIYVYYYDEDNEKLVKVAMELQKNDGFYEFYINHNSKYIISSEKIETKAISNDKSLMKLNDEENGSSGFNVLFAIIPIGIILIVLITIFIIKKNKNKKKNNK